MRVEEVNAAMEHRTVIALASGIVTAQRRCLQQEAFDILGRVSNNRNQ
ncbi:ANTAR domain-containing protein [Arthrobacter sp. Soil736]|nr:ANTAR domain-containing protein [Arthrobacter sp. Soil736]